MTKHTAALSLLPFLPLSRAEEQLVEPGSWVHTPALLLTSPVTLGASHDLSLPQFADLGCEDKKSTYLMGGRGRVK